jgi:hypothetical protein
MAHDQAAAAKRIGRRARGPTRRRVLTRLFGQAHVRFWTELTL